MKAFIEQFDLFEKLILAIMTIVTLVGVKYAYNMFLMAQMSGEMDWIMFVGAIDILVFGALILNSVLIYTLIKKVGK
ncbi:MAG: hypothetical protein GOU99_00750 [Candidatus Altiarchaeota archaeon]|nr:hypothetical protein [Candidatus Altiarchaeota archaeon]